MPIQTITNNNTFINEMKEDGLLRVGIVGAGWIAEKAAITLNGLQECEAYAIASRSLEKAEAFARQWDMK